MKLIVIIIVISVAKLLQGQQSVTKLQKNNIFLSRRKRFVQWPKGSNFVINFTCTKPLMRVQPLTWNTVYEMDVPFAVPPDNRIFFNPLATTKTKRHVAERKYLLEHLEDFMTLMGMNGPACINRLLCESDNFTQNKNRSLINELIKVLFGSFLDDQQLSEYKDKCKSEHFSSCPISLLDIFINSSAENIDSPLIPDNTHNTPVYMNSY